MIVEVGLFRIDGARAGEFARVADDIRTAFSLGSIPGLRSFHMAHALEDHERWTVLVAWGTVDDHKRFMASVEGERQRTLLAPFMTGQPEIFHVRLDDVTEGMR